MSLKISYCRYRLLFKHPFGTAHGLRTGTDSVFIKVEENGCIGYGEATLPPYLEETVDSVIQRLIALIGNAPTDAVGLLSKLEEHPELLSEGPAARAALHTALVDLKSKAINSSVRQLDMVNTLKSPTTLMTVGSGDLKDIPIKLKDTLLSGAVKVKLGASNDQDALKMIKELDHRPLFLDANQGLDTVQDALDRVAWVGQDRVIGMEQPFPKDRPDLHAALRAATEVPIYGDESIQSLADLEAHADKFSGVNVKLMKCGGLDRVKELIDRARELGLKVMLGSMSESSLGCTAMAWYADQADVVDLDGPWLIKNDPYKGMIMRNGNVVLPEVPGFGVVLTAELNWTPIGA